MGSSDVKILSFSNKTRSDKQLLKRFVNFHWDHYQHEPRFIPLLDYEFLGNKLLGMVGYFEPSNLFLTHADIKFFLAENNGKTVGRTIAYINHNYNEHWNEKTGFFGFFESINDQDVCNALLHATSEFLKSKSVNLIRGPQNLPINEATPGILTEGFDSRPVIYYHYNFPYYKDLLLNFGLKPVKNVLSYEVSAHNPMEEKLIRVSEKVKKRFQVITTPFSRKHFNNLKKDMFEIYNDAWNDNWGFVPFTEAEFQKNLDDMLLVMDKNLFIFAHVKDEPAAFFGAVPNINEKMKPLPFLKRFELLRAAKMFITKESSKGIRLGYLGVKKKFRKLGIDGVLLAEAKSYVQNHTKYDYSDIGWVLEDNTMTNRLVDFMQGKKSKVYTIYEKNLY